MLSKELKATIFYLLDEKDLPDMTPKKLQKMLYYCYSFYLAIMAHNDSDEEINTWTLFDEKFQAWVHGPVIPKVYNKYKNYKASIIENSGFSKEDIAGVLTQEQIEIIDEVIEAYGHLTGNSLESISHSELPWIEARGNLKSLDSCTNELSDKKIYNYYSSKLIYE